MDFLGFYLVFESVFFSKYYILLLFFIKREVIIGGLCEVLEVLEVCLFYWSVVKWRWEFFMYLFLFLYFVCFFCGFLICVFGGGVVFVVFDVVGFVGMVFGLIMFWGDFDGRSGWCGLRVGWDLSECWDWDVVCVLWGGFRVWVIELVWKNWRIFGLECVNVEEFVFVFLFM